MRSLRADIVRVLKSTQAALEELDRINVGAARSAMFNVNWQLRELLAVIENMERGE